jgi:hypothetical protein
MKKLYRIISGYFKIARRGVSNFAARKRKIYRIALRKVFLRHCAQAKRTTIAGVFQILRRV